jgi:hypothetical protein
MTTTHHVYRPGQRSSCPHHSWCAYTGSEPDRCPRCHRAWALIDSDSEHTAQHDHDDARRARDAALWPERAKRRRAARQRETRAVSAD